MCLRSRTKPAAALGTRQRNQRREYEHPGCSPFSFTRKFNSSELAWTAVRTHGSLACQISVLLLVNTQPECGVSAVSWAHVACGLNCHRQPGGVLLVLGWGGHTPSWNGRAREGSEDAAGSLNHMCQSHDNDNQSQHSENRGCAECGGQRSPHHAPTEKPGSTDPKTGSYRPNMSRESKRGANPTCPFPYLLRLLDVVVGCPGWGVRTR